MRIRTFAVIGALAISSLLLACAPATPTAAPAKPTTGATAGTQKPAGGAPAATSAAQIKRGGVLKFANATEPSPTLDPHTSMSSGRGFELMYGNFTKYVRDEKTGKWSAQPWYAESWEQPDPKTLVMKLKKGVKFQDGTAFNAQVAKWNFDRMMTNKISTIRQDIGAIDSVDVVDDYTIRLKLKAPPGGLLAILSDSNARGWIVSQAAVEKLGDQFGRHPVGSGPMQFVDWKDGDSITFKKWDQYWENGEDGKPLPYLDGIQYLIMPDSTVKLLSLRTGTIDATDEIPAKDVGPFRTDPNFQVLMVDWRTSTNYLFFNTTRAPWKDNVKVRQAVLYAIDGQSMANTLGFGMGKPAYYHWGSGDIGYDETLPKYDYQPEKAKQLLKDAGFANGVEFELMHWPTAPSDKAAEMIQSVWEKVGIHAKLLPTERTATEKAWMAGTFDVGLSQKQLGELDPNLMEYRFRSGEIKNYAHFDNPEIDKCFNDAREAPNDQQRGEVYKRCQTLIYNDAAYGLSWRWLSNQVLAKYVKGWTPSWRNEPNWAKVWMDK